MTAERDRRWRLTLGEDSAEPSEGVGLSADDQRMDEALAALYGGGGRPGDGSSTEPRTGGLGGSAPRVATWLGDIRTYFPSSVVQVMQRDAIDRLGVRALLLEPELMESLEPDVHLVSTLISLGSAIPETSKATARSGGPHGRRRRRAADRQPHQGRRDRGAQPRRPHPPAEAARHRLEPHHRQEPQELPARAAHRGPGAAGRLRAPPAARRTRHHPGDRPVRVDGRLGRVCVDLRRGDRVAARGAHLARGLRHRRRRPHRGAVRPGRAALRDAARRRHRHQPCDRLLPGSRHPPGGHRLRPHLRPVRGRRPRRDAGAGRAAARRGCRRRGPARAVGRGGARRSTGPWPETSPSWASPPSRAPRTRSPTCSRSPWSAATSGPGPRSRSSTSAG